MPFQINYLISIEDANWPKQSTQLNDLIVTAANAALALADVPSLFKQRPIDTNIILTNNDSVQELNSTYRDKNKPTNILTFFQIDCCDEDDLQRNASMPADMPLVFGDLYLAYDVLMAECQDQEKSFETHLSHLIIHGVLHLLGYDHIDIDEAEEMETIEIKAMHNLGFENPYADMALIDRMDA